MQPGEIAWRVSNLVRDKIDRVLLSRRQRTLAPLQRKRAVSPSDESTLTSLLPLIPGTVGRTALHSAWRAALIAEADEIVQHRIQLIGSRRVDVGTPIRWNYEYNKNAATPTTYAGDIDYRDYDATGDCKWVWELNRHHHLVVLGRAFRATGNVVYAQEVVDQIVSWMDACEFGTGMNWRSPLELSIRLINWVYALELIATAGVIDIDTNRRIETSIYQHLWDVSRKYSRFSSANNHLIGEAAGVYVAACRYPHLPNAEAWRRDAKRILIHEISDQVDADGVHRELATGYHLFVLQFFAIAHIVGRQSDDAFPDEYTARLDSMGEFPKALSAGGRMPLFGDCDDGYVLDLGGDRGDPRPWIEIVDRIVGHSTNDGASGESRHEAANWLLGPNTDTCTAANPQSTQLRSTCFEEAGIYLLQSGRSDSDDAISVTVDVGPLGFKSIAAHGHADALSMTLRAFGAEFLIDPGTYDYFTHPEWRDYFRMTRAHNTIEIDGLDQSEMLGKFMWGQRANARCIDWRPDGSQSRLIAEHDGYTRLSDPVIHRRSITLHESSGCVRIDDALDASASHNAAIHFHFAPECRVELVGDRVVRASRDEGAIEMTLPDIAEIRLSKGETSPILGWCSRAYHEKQPITTVRAGLGFRGRIRLTTTVQVCKA